MNVISNETFSFVFPSHLILEAKVDAVETQMPSFFLIQRNPNMRLIREDGNQVSVKHLTRAKSLLLFAELSKII